jgi:hypothetical protein
MKFDTRLLRFNSTNLPEGITLIPSGFNAVLISGTVKDTSVVSSLVTVFYPTAQSKDIIINWVNTNVKPTKIRISGLENDSECDFATKFNGKTLDLSVDEDMTGSSTYKEFVESDGQSYQISINFEYEYSTNITTILVTSNKKEAGADIGAPRMGWSNS